MGVPNILENELCRFPPVGSCTDDGSKTVRRTQIPYDYAFLVDIKLAYIGVSFVDNAGQIVRWLPYEDPDDITQVIIRADSQGVGYGNDRPPSLSPDVPFQTGIGVKYWNLTLHFSTIPYRLGEIATIAGDAIVGQTPTYEVSRYCSKTVREDREYVTPPFGGIWIDSSPERVQLSYAVPFMIPFTDIEVIWWHVPYAAYPYAAIDKCQGCINSVDLRLPEAASPTLGYVVHGANTILFLGVRKEEMRFPDGSWGYNIHYFFKRLGDDDAAEEDQRGINWNSFLNSAGVWTPIYRAKTGPEHPYTAVDLNSLFVSGAIV